MAPDQGGRAALDDLASHCVLIAKGDIRDWKLSQREQVGQVIEWAGRIRERGGKGIELEDFQILSGFDCSLGRIRKNNDTYNLIKQLKDDLIPAAAPLLAGEYYGSQRATLIEAMGRFDNLYRSRKAAQSALDFEDLQEFTVRLLEENDDARESIQGQFDYILMDEFQDTNGLQSKLLGSAAVAGPVLRGGRYQSIDLRFSTRRSAGVPLVPGAGGGRGQAHLAELRENWRSRKEILDAVSSLVGRSEGVEPHAFSPAQDFKRKKEPSVEVIRCLGDEALEAKWVASRIVAMRGTLSLESGKAEFGDMAVLVRKADSIKAFTDAFDEASIPYAVTAGKGFFEAREVNDLTHLLRRAGESARRDQPGGGAAVAAGGGGGCDSAAAQAVRRYGGGDGGIGARVPSRSGRLARGTASRLGGPVC